MLNKGDSAIYVELEQDDVNKRFLLPAEDGIEDRLKALLKRHPSIHYVRSGRATVTTVSTGHVSDEAYQGFGGLPSKVAILYDVVLSDHPVIVNGTARYSIELCDELDEMETAAAEVAVSAQPERKEDLATQLRQQLLNQKTQEVKSASQETPVLEKVEGTKETTVIQLPQNRKIKDDEPQQQVKSLDEALKEAQSKRQTRPLSKIDLVLKRLDDIEIKLGGTVEEQEEVDPKELAQWFSDHVKIIGFDATFEQLAKRMKY